MLYERPSLTSLSGAASSGVCASGSTADLDAVCDMGDQISISDCTNGAGAQDGCLDGAAVVFGACLAGPSVNTGCWAGGVVT